MVESVATNVRRRSMISPLDKRLSEWTSADVERLVAHQVDEGQRLDYKRELHLSSRAEKAEAAKDVSGMANAIGGWILYGVAEETLTDRRVVPRRVEPLRDGS